MIHICPEEDKLVESLRSQGWALHDRSCSRLPFKTENLGGSWKPGSVCLHQRHVPGRVHDVLPISLKPSNF
jgi:hypothetical protein